jgi:hypothetical protein
MPHLSYEDYSSDTSMNFHTTPRCCNKQTLHLECIEGWCRSYFKRHRGYTARDTGDPNQLEEREDYGHGGNEWVFITRKAMRETTGNSLHAGDNMAVRLLRHFRLEAAWLMQHIPSTRKQRPSIQSRISVD